MGATATTVMTYAPAREGDRAGLVAFQNDDHYYFLAVALQDGRPVIQLEMEAGERTRGEPAMVASAPSTCGPVSLSTSR